jgi:hypothetical protein
MSKQNTPMHRKLLVASYFLGALSTLLSALAAISAASEHGKLLYPDINNTAQPTNPASNAKKYFEL